MKNPFVNKNVKVYDDYMVVKRRVKLDSLNFRTLKPGEKIYAAIVTSYRRTQSYRNTQELKIMKLNQEKYDLLKDGITYIAEFLNSNYNDSQGKKIQLIIKPNMVFLLPLLKGYFPEWEVQIYHALPSISALLPLPSIVEFSKKVIA